MIIVIGSPVARLDAGTAFAAGIAARVALAAATAGRDVQLLGKVGDDPAADGLLLDLARGGVGHVALLRDVAHATPLVSGTAAEPADVDADAPDRPGSSAAGLRLEAADVDLGLRYLTTFDVLVLVGSGEAGVPDVVAEAARWAGARLVLVAGRDEALPDGLPSDAIAFEAPDADPDGAFATLVGSFAAALDDGTDPAEAFRASIAADGWTETAGD